MGYGKFKFVIWAKQGYEPIVEKLAEMYTKYEWSYLIHGNEVAPTTGALHVDGYYEMPTGRKFETELKKFAKTFGVGWGDLQSARGTAGENFDYSTKEARGGVEKGVAVVNGQSKNLSQYKEELRLGSITVDEIVMTDPMAYHTYGRTLTKIEDIAMRQRFRTEMTTGIWYWGPTGVGKSVKAYYDYKPDTHYTWKLSDKGWQDDYTQQETVVINDFRGEGGYNHLLNLMDWTPGVAVSRRSRPPLPFTSKHIIITSSLPPDKVFHNRMEEDNMAQLYRRCKVVHISAIDNAGRMYTDQGIELPNCYS